MTFEKPECRLIGENSNVFAIIGAVNKTLKRAGLEDQAKEFADKAMASKSYDEVLAMLDDYVEVV